MLEIFTSVKISCFGRICFLWRHFLHHPKKAVVESSNNGATVQEYLAGEMWSDQQLGGST